MRPENLSTRQIAVLVPVLGLLCWSILQFALLPHMTEQERRGIYPAWMSTPYPYAVSLVFISFASWFAFLYRGRYSTHGRRMAAFAIVLGALCGMLMILVIRHTWHV